MEIGQTEAEYTGDVSKQVLQDLKALQRTLPGTPEFIEMQKKILNEASEVEAPSRGGLRHAVESIRADIRTYRPSYYTPEYFRVLTLLSKRLEKRGFATVKRELDEAFRTLEESFESGHFRHYPSFYIKRIRYLAMKAGREADAAPEEVARLAEAADGMVERIKAYEYENVSVDVSKSRLRIQSLFTVGEGHDGWSAELISPGLEYGGRSFLKRKALAYSAKEDRPLSRPEIERGIGEKISYFPCIAQSLARKYLIVPVPGENKYELTGTGKRVGEIYIKMIEDTEEKAAG